MKNFMFIAALFLICGCGGGGGSDATDEASDDSSSTPTESSAFGAGKHLVGQDIAPGRYFSNPAKGCYWERLSGLGGTTDEIIANEFIAFDSPQEIVDIGAADLAFSTDSDCGDWFTTPRQGRQDGIIPPGNWLVGSQITPGTYSVLAGDGCYWERLRSFSGVTDAIIANDFVRGASTQLVSIAATDVGFSTDGDCGTWTPLQSPTGRERPAISPAQSLESIEQNRAENRRQEQARR